MWEEMVKEKLNFASPFIHFSLSICSKLPSSRTRNAGKGGGQTTVTERALFFSHDPTARKVHMLLIHVWQLRATLLRKAVLMKECVFAQSHCFGERTALSEKDGLYGLADCKGAANYKVSTILSQTRSTNGVYLLKYVRNFVRSSTDFPRRFHTYSGTLVFVKSA